MVKIKTRQERKRIFLCVNGYVNFSYVIQSQAHLPFQQLLQGEWSWPWPLCSVLLWCQNQVLSHHWSALSSPHDASNRAKVTISGRETEKGEWINNFSLNAWKRRRVLGVSFSYFLHTYEIHKYYIQGFLYLVCKSRKVSPHGHGTGDPRWSAVLKEMPCVK